MENVSIVFFSMPLPVVSGHKQKYQMFIWQRTNANLRNEDYLLEYSFRMALLYLLYFLDFSLMRAFSFSSF